MSRRCNIVTPIYHDVESFLLLHKNILANLDGADDDATLDVHFYAIDDSGGRDPEIDRLRELDRVTVITPPFNLGHQRALVLGLRVASSRFGDDDFVVTMDSDGEDRPEDIRRLLDALEETDDPWTVVVARRTSRQASLNFRVLYSGFVLLFRMLTGRVIRSGNFAAYRGLYARRMLFHPMFDLCYSSSLVALERQPLFVPCARGERYAGQSRMGLLNLLMHGVRMMMPLADRIAVRALIAGAMIAVVTVISFVTLILLQLTGVFDSTLVTGVLLAVGGIAAGLALVTFLVLFTGFVQTSGLSMAQLHEQVRIGD